LGEQDLESTNTYADRWRNILLERRRTSVGRHLTRWLTALPAILGDNNER
jgi:hypothetical protein